MSETSSNASFSVINAEDEIDTLSINSTKDFDTSSVKSEDTILDEQIDEPPVIDNKPYLTDAENLILDEYPQDCATLMLQVYHGCPNTWSKRFGRNDQLQVQTYGACGNGFRFYVYYYGDRTNMSETIRIRVYGKSGLLEDRYNGDAMKTYEPKFKGQEEQMYAHGETLYMYVYVRVMKKSVETNPWIRDLVYGEYFYSMGDFTVKLKDGDVKVWRGILAQFCPYFRGFFAEFPEATDITLIDYGIDTFKRIVEFLMTRKELNALEVTEEMARLVKFLGAPPAIAEVDHLMNFWSSSASFCQYAVLGRDLGYPVMQRDSEMLAGLHWPRVLKANREFIMDHMEYFLSIKSAPFFS